MNKSTQTNIGILGGSFNPPHIAHSIVAQSVREQMKFDKIIFIPTGNHPLKKSIDSGLRLEMAKLAFGENVNFEVSDIEVKNKSGLSFTVNTLKTLNEMYEKNNVKLNLIIGADNLIELPKWKDPEKLFELCNVIVINRPEYSPEDSKAEFYSKVKFVRVPHLEISSTMIRKLISEKRSIGYLVAPPVEKFIYKNNLYE
ncbi:MAG: nicotinate-nucleotide adenylyltransferase [bacterium]|nr:nicotinate-nucleotide adenylyltransferase [bacterium]